LTASGRPAAAEPEAAARVQVASPDGRIRAEVFLEGDDKAPGVPHYQITFQNKPVALRARLGIDLADGSALGASSTIERVKTRSFRESYTQFPGKRSRVRDEGEEAVIDFREHGPVARRWQLVVRVHDDGAAFRYRFPAQEGWTELAIVGERTEFQFPAASWCHASQLGSFTTPHEDRYNRRPISEIEKGWLMALPFLVEVPGTGWTALLDANLTDFAALYVAGGNEPGAPLTARLAPRTDAPKVAVRSTLPHESPWRVFMIADRVERLIESDLVLNLNAPCAIGDTSWIKLGKTTFPWWNGFYEEKLPFKPGLNTATAKYYIDFCAEAGIAFHSLDGLDNVAWYGGPIVPYQGADIVQGLPGLDLQEVIRHAKAKGVGLRLWMNWRAADRFMDHAFPLYRAWGINGVMVDFLDRDDQPINQFIHRLLRTAAANKLTVTIHNTHEPTGLERTYPHLLTTEGVMNLEFDKWDKVGITPEHEVTIPFTRMLAGPLDFHQGSFRGVAVNEYRPRNAAPLVMGTPCRMLASYVVYQNHLPMMADYPSAYRGHPLLPVLANVPVTWDDTRCLSGRVGEWVLIARRSGAEWWVGGMTDRHSRTLPVPLSFLGEGTYRATIYGDDANAPFKLDVQKTAADRTSVVKARFAPAGGVLIHIVPAGNARG
jgi:alpha-glucosidase